MPEFGDEWIIESYKVPWLIWIQLVVTILLIMLLLFGFTIFTSDSSAAVLQSTGGGAAAAPPTHPDKPSSSNTFFTVEDQRDRRNQGTSRELIREEVQGGEESTAKDSTFFSIFRHTNNFIAQAKRALLKCLGLDTSSDQHEKQD